MGKGLPNMHPGSESVSKYWKKNMEEHLYSPVKLDSFLIFSAKQKYGDCVSFWKSDLKHIENLVECQPGGFSHLNWGKSGLLLDQPWAILGS